MTGDASVRMTVSKGKPSMGKRIQDSPNPAHCTTGPGKPKKFCLPTRSLLKWSHWVKAVTQLTIASVLSHSPGSVVALGVAVLLAVTDL